MKRDLEARLRSESEAFRREPAPSLRESVRGAIAAGAEGARRAPLDGPEPLHPWRDRVKTTSVAAAVLVAAGLWIFALGGIFGGGATGGPANATGSGLAQGAAGADSEGSTPASALARLARNAPDSLTTAVESPLLAELGRIADDATSAARFLVGRLPAPLASNALEDRR